jgi:hypothetical protein
VNCEAISSLILIEFISSLNKDFNLLRMGLLVYDLGPGFSQDIRVRLCSIRELRYEMG